MPDLQGWRQRGRCRELSFEEVDEIFFPEKHVHATAAKNYCRECPVINVCRAYAVFYKEDGFWGGLTANDKREIRKSPVMLEILETYLLENGSPETRESLVPRGEQSKGRYSNVVPLVVSYSEDHSLNTQEPQPGLTIYRLGSL